MSSTNRGGKRSEADFYETPAWCVAYPLPDGHLSQLVSQGDRFGRCAACLAAEAKAKGEAK